MNTPILLVDARNCMYRAIYAGKQEENRMAAAGRARPHRHYFTIMLKLISGWITDYNPGQVQIFWDAPRQTVWRRKIYSGYKDRDNKRFIADISQDLYEVETIAREMFEVMNVYQFRRQKMEADDLIYAACKQQCHRPMVICSTDADMLQIPWSMSCVRVYHPEKRQEVTPPQHSPVQIKALMGDVSDRIAGYSGIGPKKAAKLLESPTVLHEFLQQQGRHVYIRNLLLVDLSLCPDLLANQLYVGKVLAKRPVFNRSRLLELANSHKVAGLQAEFNELVGPFQALPNA